MKIDKQNENLIENLSPDITDYNTTQNVKKKKKTSSKYHGVSWDENSNSWRVGRKLLGIFMFAGSFDNELEAAKASDALLMQLKDPGDAKFNFPTQAEEKNLQEKLTSHPTKTITKKIPSARKSTKVNRRKIKTNHKNILVKDALPPPPLEDVQFAQIPTLPPPLPVRNFAFEQNSVSMPLQNFRNPPPPKLFVNLDQPHIYSRQAYHHNTTRRPNLSSPQIPNHALKNKNPPPPFSSSPSVVKSKPITKKKQIFDVNLARRPHRFAIAESVCVLQPPPPPSIIGKRKVKQHGRKQYYQPPQQYYQSPKTLLPFTPPVSHTIADTRQQSSYSAPRQQSSYSATRPRRSTAHSQNPIYSSVPPRRVEKKMKKQIVKKNHSTCCPESHSKFESFPDLENGDDWRSNFKCSNKIYTLQDIAKLFNEDVDCLLHTNLPFHIDLTKRAQLQEGTIIYLPKRIKDEKKQIAIFDRNTKMGLVRVERNACSAHPAYVLKIKLLGEKDFLFVMSAQSEPQVLEQYINCRKTLDDLSDSFCPRLETKHGQYLLFWKVPKLEIYLGSFTCEVERENAQNIIRGYFRGCVNPNFNWDPNFPGLGSFKNPREREKTTRILNKYFETCLLPMNTKCHAYWADGNEYPGTIVHKYRCLLFIKFDDGTWDYVAANLVRL